MKYLYPLSILVVGLAIGYVVGVNSIIEDSNNQITTTDSVTTKLIYDTIITKEVVEVPIIVKETHAIDTVVIDNVDSNLVILDTLTETFIEKPKDTLFNENIKINKDKRIASTKINITYLENSVDEDSLIKSALDINDVENRTIVIEFWESPVNYSGYKLSKSKLIVYGLSSQFDYKMYKKEDVYYLNFQSIFYQMIETNQFLPYLLIEQLEVLND